MSPDTRATIADFDPEFVREGIATTRFRLAEFLLSTGSTQTELIERGANVGDVIVANHQTQGRGRLSRSWVQEPGNALLLSVAFEILQPQLAGLVVALSVVEALDSFDIFASIKWPNDVLIADEKVGGILGEVLSASEGLSRVAVGCGINVCSAPAIVGEGGLPAGFIGSEIRRDTLLIAVLRFLEDNIDSATVIERATQRCVTLNRQVRVELKGESFEGQATAITEGGALVVDGREVTAGDVIHCTALD